MKNYLHLSRQDVRNEYVDIVNKYGKPKSGKIFCIEQLISEIAHVLLCFDEANITYEYGEFDVSSGIGIKGQYAPDHKYIGRVLANEWYTPEQLKAMHEVGFGYQF